MAQENSYYLGLDREFRVCSDVLMGGTKHITMRIPEEILLLVDEQAKRMRWSRNTTLNTCIEFGLPDLELERGGRVNELSGANKKAESAGADEAGNTQGWVESRDKGGGAAGGGLLGGGHGAQGAGRRNRKGNFGVIETGAGKSERIGEAVKVCPECGALGGNHFKGCKR